MNRRDFLRCGALWVGAGIVTAETLDWLDWSKFRRIHALGGLRSQMSDDEYLRELFRLTDAFIRTLYG